MLVSFIIRSFFIFLLQLSVLSAWLYQHPKSKWVLDIHSSFTQTSPKGAKAAEWTNPKNNVAFQAITYNYGKFGNLESLITFVTNKLEIEGIV